MRLLHLSCLTAVLALAAALAGCADDAPVPTGPIGLPPTVVRHVDSADYLANRFFRLDLPQHTPGVERPDAPGRPAWGVIDPVSIRVYRAVLVDNHQPDDIAAAAAFRDTSGIWDCDFSPGGDLARTAPSWRPVDLEMMTDTDGRIVAVDLLAEFLDSDVLAAVYDVVDPATQELLYSVGDRPGRDEERRIDLHGDGTLYYRLKLLKDSRLLADPHTWQLALRNVYSLGATHIWSLDLSIELLGDALQQPELDANGLPWFRILGLDRQDALGGEGPDGVADWHDPLLFDLQRGLLRFPLELPEPFAARREVYEALAASDAFVWETSLLPDHLAPELYDLEAPPGSLSQFSRFRLVVTTALATRGRNGTREVRP